MRIMIDESVATGSGQQPSTARVTGITGNNLTNVPMQQICPLPCYYTDGCFDVREGGRSCGSVLI